jgi:predicted XRE-type DNA-binding protein
MSTAFDLNDNDFLSTEKRQLETVVGIEFLNAFLECSDAIQKSVVEMIGILKDPETDPDDRAMTLHTLAEALFPDKQTREYGLDLERSEAESVRKSPELAGIVERMDREEEAFARTLQTIMEQRGLSQSELAEKMGISQPAISNMLNRNCRPQRRTIQRLAQALDVPENTLWKDDPSS